MNSVASGSGTREAAWLGSIDGKPSLRRADRPGQGRAARSPYDDGTVYVNLWEEKRIDVLTLLRDRCGLKERPVEFVGNDW